MKDKMVIRTINGLEIEERADKKPLIRGYASVFDSESQQLGWFIEVVRKGAFKRTLEENPDIRALLDHDTGKIIGRTKAGNLKIEEDSRGLKVTLEPIDTEDGRKAVEWVRSGVVDGMSIGFMPKTVRWSLKDGVDLREILDLTLYEVSLVAFPAFSATSATVRTSAGCEVRSLAEISAEGKDILKKEKDNQRLHLRTKRAQRVLKTLS